MPKKTNRALPKPLLACKSLHALKHIPLGVLGVPSEHFPVPMSKTSYTSHYSNLQINQWTVGPIYYPKSGKKALAMPQ